MSDIAASQHSTRLDVLEEIDRFGRSFDGRINPEQEAWLRQVGIYTQRPVDDGFLMVRIRIPGGNLIPPQLETIARLADEHGRGLADITVRQNIQLHWVRPKSLVDIITRLHLVGLSTIETCGESVRNIVNCPVSGVDENELFDTTPLVRQVNKFFFGNPEFGNLPRKFKITISGCALRCTYPEIHDIGLFAERDRKRNRVRFRARVGGGLSTSPRFSSDLGVLVDPEDVLELCAAVAGEFRDHGARNGGERSRLKFLLEERQVPAFLAEVEKRFGGQLDRAPQPSATPLADRDRSHLGIHGQHTLGLYYIGISILGGRTSGEELLRLASLAERFGSGRVRTTNTQNIIALDVPEWNLQELSQELDRAGLEYEPSWSRKAIIACTGIQFCKQALTETKNRAAELNAHLENEVQLDQPVRISVTGCANACGQHHIADLGLEGSSTTVDGAKHESFQILVGGGVGLQESFARRLGLRIRPDELSESIARLFAAYKQFRTNAETFQEFCNRHSEERLGEFLTGSSGFDGGASNPKQVGTHSTDERQPPPPIDAPPQ
jgi:sulfite reductase beta subunit-like hemoprotein